MTICNFHHSLMPIATRPWMDSPIANGTWTMLPIKVFRLLPTNSTLRLNGIRKMPCEPVTEAKKGPLRYHRGAKVEKTEKVGKN